MKFETEVSKELWSLAKRGIYLERDDNSETYAVDLNDTTYIVRQDIDGNINSYIHSYN